MNNKQIIFLNDNLIKIKEKFLHKIKIFIIFQIKQKENILIRY